MIICSPLQATHFQKVILPVPVKLRLTDLLQVIKINPQSYLKDLHLLTFSPLLLLGFPNLHLIEMKTFLLNVQ